MTVRPRLPAMERWFVFWVYVKLKKMICSAEPHVGRLDIEQVSGQEYRIDAWCTHVLRRDRSNGNTDQASGHLLVNAKSTKMIQSSTNHTRSENMRVEDKIVPVPQVTRGS